MVCSLSLGRPFAALIRPQKLDVDAIGNET